MTDPTWPTAHRFLSPVGWVLLTLCAAGVATALLVPRRTSCGGGPREACRSNLRQIDHALEQYRQDHGGRYPASLGELAAVGGITPNVFVCPSSFDVPSTGATTPAVAADLDAGPAGGRCSFVYCYPGPTTRPLEPSTVVVYEPSANHDGDGSNALFGDGHAEWLTPAGLARVLATTRPAGGLP